MLRVRNLVVMLQTELGEQAGLNPLEDRFKVGYITACRDFLDPQLEDEE